MKTKQQLLQEQKQLRTKLAQVTKQINLQEVSRMQQIAGVKPKRFLKENFEEGGPEWINPNSPRAKILTDVYYIGDNAEGDLYDMRGSAVPAYELTGYSLEDIENEGDGMLYIKSGEEGWYDENEGEFESKDENSNTRIEKEYIELI